MAILTLSKDNFDQIVADKDLVIVDFSAEWCVPCKSFAKVFATAAEKYPDGIFASIDIDKEPELAADFNIRSVPFLIIMRQNIAVFAESGALTFTALDDLIQKARALDMVEVRKQIEQQKS